MFNAEGDASVKASGAALLAASLLLPSTALTAPLNELPEMPPAAPGPDERSAGDVQDEVVSRCAQFAQKMREGVGTRLVKVVVTDSPNWGTIWRADSAFPASAGEPPYLWRSACWNGGVLERPVGMFDPKDSVPPL